MDDVKTCPDCAESVRAQARRCRFCGYRFDGQREAGALDFLLRRPPPRLRMDELLGEWGIELEEQESVAFFGFCRLEDHDGYLLVSSVRVAFFAGRRAERILEWPRAEIHDVALGSGRRARDLALSGPGGSVRLRRFESRRALADAARQLGARER